MKYGPYIVSWAGLPEQYRDHDIMQEALLRDLGVAQAHGCNVAHISNVDETENLAYLKGLFWMAHNSRMGLIVEDLSDEQTAMVAGTPGFLARSVMDDADSETSALFKEVRKTLGSQVATHEALEYLARNSPHGVPTMASIGPSLRNARTKHWGLTNGVLVQSHIWPTESLLTSLNIWRNARRRGDAYGQEVWGVAQLRSYQVGSPSYAQIEAQVWVAKIAKLDGVLGYAYRDQAGYVDAKSFEAFCKASALANLIAPRDPKSVVVDSKHILTATFPGNVEVRIDIGKGVVLYAGCRDKLIAEDKT